MDFDIFYRAGKTNPADPSSRRPDYQGEDNLGAVGMLPTLQNKLALVDKGPSEPSVVREIRLSYTRKGRAQRHRDPRPKDNTLDGEDIDLSPRGELDISPTDIRRKSDASPTEKETSPLAGTADCKQRVPRQAARKAAKDETAYSKSSLSVQELILWLQGKDPIVKSKKQGLAKYPKNAGPWSVDDRDALLYHKSLYVPEDSALKQELLVKYHDDPLAGHFGYEKTVELIRRWYNWPGLTTEIRDYINTCDVCQRVKVYRHKPYGKMQLLPKPIRPWEEITVDFIIGFPPSKTYNNMFDTILVVVDRFTKIARYIPCRKNLIAKEFADIFIDEIISKYRTPEGIVSDRGSLFISLFWSDIYFLLKIKRRLSTAFHPQTDGQTERQNQTLKHYLRVYANEE